MAELQFEWDLKKNKSNAKKHGVSFEDAQTTFYDEKAIVFDDPDHSDEEHRFILLGTNHKLKILIVCHCYREKETIIRIISARTADKEEEQFYWTHRS
jgi:uncharacterized DUF497 family protein